jgi:hypothetical protein
VCAAIFLAAAPSIAPAAGVVGTGTAASCTDAALDTALAGGGLVTFNCGGQATIDISTATGGTGTKFIFADTTIDGGGLVTISGGHLEGIFSVGGPQDATGPSFTVNHLTIADGVSGIFNGSGTVIVTNSTFTGHFRAPDTFAYGAIINGLPISSVNTSLTVTNSTFTDNAGGILISAGGPVTVTNSTFTGNSFFGAIFSQGGTLTVTNSTFTGNSISDEFLRHPGGGGAINFTNSFFGPALVRNSVLANNSSVEGGVSFPARNCSGAISDGGHNLDDGTSCGFTTANGSLNNTNPQLDPAGLRDNGGPTQTVALCTAAGVPAGCSAASPAIDAGDQAVCAAASVNDLDQRGFMRPGPGHTKCSIGAYEANGTAPAVCVGDCAGTGTVAINDLITLVNIALGSAQPSACPHGVPSGAEVDIALIVRAVNNVLNGCGPTVP